MKILVITGIDESDPNKTPPVNLWRLIRPMRELAKHMPDWQIDEQPTFIEQIESYKTKEEFTEVELEQAARTLGAYDIVFSSYYSNRATYVLTKVVHDRYGTEFVTDMDDDYYNINPDNPVWTKITKQQQFDVWSMIEDMPWMTTTCERLATVLRARRKRHTAGSVGILPNYITDDFKQYEAPESDRIVIGYMGGTSHWNDVHESGFARALIKIVRHFPQVDVRAIAFPIDIPIAEKRMQFVDAKSGFAYVTDVFPQFKAHIMVAPILDNLFNRSKSNIKWQEYTRAGAVTIASDIGPYRDLPDDVLYKVTNQRGHWYQAMEELIGNEFARRIMLTKARGYLKSSWRLEDHWGRYRDFFEYVMNNKPVKL